MFTSIVALTNSDKFGATVEVAVSAADVISALALSRESAKIFKGGLNDYTSRECDSAAKDSPTMWPTIPLLLMTKMPHLTSKGGWLWRHSISPRCFARRSATIAYPACSRAPWSVPRPAPPYNIEKTGDNQYRIVLAVAGFTKDDIELVQEQSRLAVRGALKEQSPRTYLHRGIANRAFERHFELADHVEVTDARMGEGLLVIAQA